MSCKPTYKGVRYNSLEELYNANGVNTQQAQQLYSQYLDTIFPDSKVKDIVWHRSLDNITEFKYQEDSLGQFYFSAGKDSIWDIIVGGEGQLYKFPVLLNIKNPKIEEADLSNHGNQSYNSKFLKQKGYDALLVENKDDYKNSERIVFEPEQIHILSSKKDLEMFKNFINFTKSEYAKYGDIQQFKDYIMSKNFAAVEEFLVVNNKIDRKC